MMLVCPLILSGQLLLFIDLMADVEPFLLCLDRCFDRISGRSYCQVTEGRCYCPMFGGGMSKFVGLIWAIFTLSWLLLLPILI